MADETSRVEHCAFAVLDKNGKCIAYCNKNIIVDGISMDCIGITSESIKDYVSRIQAETKHH